MSRASAGEVNQRAMGNQSVQDYLNKYAPIEAGVAQDLLSTAGNQEESGRVQAAQGMAWNNATQAAQTQNLTESAPTSGAFVAKTLDLSRKRGSGMGMAKVQTAQGQADKESNKLTTGVNIGRALTNVSTGGMRYSDQVSQQDLMEKKRLQEERQDRLYGMAGQVAGVGMGAYAQSQALKKSTLPPVGPNSSGMTPYSLLNQAQAPSPYSLQPVTQRPSSFSLSS